MLAIDEIELILDKVHEENKYLHIDNYITAVKIRLNAKNEINEASQQYQELLEDEYKSETAEVKDDDD